MHEIKLPFYAETCCGVFADKNNQKMMFLIKGDTANVLAHLFLLIAHLKDKGIPLLLIKSCLDYLERNPKEIDGLLNGTIRINMTELERQAGGGK